MAIGENHQPLVVHHAHAAVLVVLSYLSLQPRVFHHPRCTGKNGEQDRDKGGLGAVEADAGSIVHHNVVFVHERRFVDDG